MCRSLPERLREALARDANRNFPRSVFLDERADAFRATVTIGPVDPTSATGSSRAVPDRPSPPRKPTAYGAAGSSDERCDHLNQR